MNTCEINSIILSFVKSKEIYDKSIYKYGVYKRILEIKFPTTSDYFIKKKFDSLIQTQYIIKIPHERSYLYQFNNHSNITIQFEEPSQFVKNKKGEIVLFF
tara:strand:+ start:1261 stop:1563 length:303 start_codon:yes stop_codon:yes gene_type:complete